MPNVSSNIVVYSTKEQVYDDILLSSGLSLNTYTLLCSAESGDSAVTDILFKNTGTTTAFGIVICSTSGQADSSVFYPEVNISANSGTGSTAIASVAALAPSLFDIDMAGNRVISLKTGYSIYVKNLSSLSADIYVRAKRRNY